MFWRKSHLAYLVLVGSAALTTATTVWSQQPRGAERGEFRGPFRRSEALPGSLAILLQIPEVQKELSIDDEQRKAVEKLQDDVRDKMDEVLRDFPPGPPPEDNPREGDRPRVDFRAKIEELNKQTDGQIEKLLKSKQFDRLRQLQLQNEGVAAFIKPEVAEKLALTGEQKDKLRDIQDRGSGGFGPPQIDPKDKADALTLLTADQKSKWEALVGAEVKLPESFGPGGPGGNRFFGSGGPMGGAERKIAKQFDKNGDGWLNLDERKAARELLAKQPQRGRGGPGGRGPGGRGPGGVGPGGGEEAGKQGPKVSPDEAKTFSDEVSLYDPTVLRTLFLEFENPDWEAELEEFHNTDVEVPATLTVDGKKYPNVGVHFRGMSSYGGVRRGSKRSMNLSLDTADAKQRLLGYKTLNLLNAHEDPTFLHTVLYSHIARQYIPAPKANFVKVVINGESWGIYTNAQQFDKIFAAENYFKSNGTRWRVRGSPGGDGGLSYVGDNVEEYKRRYEIKSGDKAEAWEALIKLCRTLKETPIDQLEEALKPMLDIDEALWFLALDNTLINCDGYWIRASDYCIYLDEAGKFHIVPHDMNETFQAAMGPGMGGGPGGFGGRRGGPEGRGLQDGRDGPQGRGAEGRGRGAGRDPEGRDEDAPEGRGREGRGPEGRDGPEARGPEGRGPEGRGGRGPGGGGAAGGFTLDPLVGMNEARKPLRSRLLAVPSLREKYLQHVRTIAQDWLDWEKLSTVVDQYQALIEKELEQDTRKLSSFAAFQQAISSDEAPSAEAGPGRGRGGSRNLKSFAEERRKYLLDHPEIKKLP
jgi:spore coat protein CotH